MNRMMKTSLLALMTVAFAACAQSNGGTTEAGPDTQRAGTSACSLKLPSSGLCVALQWENQPPAGQEGSFLLQLSNPETGAALDPLNGDVGVVLWMPDMGHGSLPVTITKVSAGLYRVSHVVFVMGGQWEIRVQIKLGTQVQEQVVENVEI